MDQFPSNYIFQAISLDKLITDLNISSNRLGLESSGAVRDFLKLNRLIEKLDLSCNNLTVEGGINILDGLKYNTSIKYLDVRYVFALRTSQTKFKMSQI